MRTEFHFWGHFSVNADMSIREHGNTHIVSTDPDTGKVLLVERNVLNASSQHVLEVLDERAGTLTATFMSTYRGALVQVANPGPRCDLLDAGTLTIGTFTVVRDLTTGEFVSFETTYSDMHGPHPSLSQSEEEWN